jgi:hypothetical protein
MYMFQMMPGRPLTECHWLPEGGCNYDPGVWTLPILDSVDYVSIDYERSMLKSFKSLARRNQLRPCRSPKQR